MPHEVTPADAPLSWLTHSIVKNNRSLFKSLNLGVVSLLAINNGNGNEYSIFYSTDEWTEAQRNEIPWPKQHSSWGWYQDLTPESQTLANLTTTSYSPRAKHELFLLQEDACHGEQPLAMCPVAHPGLRVYLWIHDLNPQHIIGAQKVWVGLICNAFCNFPNPFLPVASWLSPKLKGGTGQGEKSFLSWWGTSARITKQVNGRAGPGAWICQIPGHWPKDANRWFQQRKDKWPGTWSVGNV